ncbi:MAG: hypothetical protein ACD_29C00031G0005 [uncultured bacterium]|nr:MAG: hypothetical protein ACD_29C00031G0005 [uncultured bacterium]
MEKLHPEEYCNRCKNNMTLALSKKSSPILAIVIPVYNEEKVLDQLIFKLLPVFCDLILKQKILENSFILFVDDGSQDNTWSIIKNLCEQKNYFKAIKLSRNYGHQQALLSGLLAAKENADCVISMDADLQDDVELLRKFIDGYIEGYEVIYAIRKERNIDTFFKRQSASFFYYFMQKMAVKIKKNHADYRLASKKVLDYLSEFNEVNIFLRGIFPMIGFSSTEIFYNRQKRAAGKTKYPLMKMLSFALDGITSFSNTPLRFIAIFGFLIFMLSLLFSGYVFIEKFILHSVVRGWSSLVLSIYMLSGIQLLSLGIIGEYIGKIYSETKRRPRFIIEEKLM